MSSSYVEDKPQQLDYFHTMMLAAKYKCMSSVTVSTTLRTRPMDQEREGKETIVRGAGEDVERCIGSDFGSSMEEGIQGVVLA